MRSMRVIMRKKKSDDEARDERKEASHMHYSGRQEIKRIRAQELMS